MLRVWLLLRVEEELSTIGRLFSHLFLRFAPFDTLSFSLRTRVRFVHVHDFTHLMFTDSCLSQVCSPYIQVRHPKHFLFFSFPLFSSSNALLILFFFLLLSVILGY